MQNLIHQTDKRLPRVFNLYGCNFRSLQAGVELYTGKVLDIEDILYAYVEALTREPPAMDKELTIRWPDPILNLTLALLGEPQYRGYQVGKQENGVATWWGWGKIEERIDFSVKKGYTVLGHDHFRLGDSKGALLWDPHGDKPEINKELMTIYYQIRPI